MVGGSCWVVYGSSSWTRDREELDRFRFESVVVVVGREEERVKESGCCTGRDKQRVGDEGSDGEVGDDGIGDGGGEEDGGGDPVVDLGVVVLVATLLEEAPP